MTLILATMAKDELGRKCRIGTQDLNFGGVGWLVASDKGRLRLEEWREQRTVLTKQVVA